MDAAEVDRLLSGDLGGRSAAPGWPHDDTAPGLGFAHHGGLAFLVLDDDDRVAGECGTKTPPQPDGLVEIGYGLAAPSRGHGLGTAAVAALLVELSRLPGARTVEAEVHEANAASRALVERLGFTVSSGPIAGYLRYRRPLPADA